MTASLPELPESRGRVILTRLDIRNLRNIRSLTLAPEAGVNVVLGANGAGKTSVLEGIWMLSRGRSFRAGRIEQVVREGEATLQVVGRVAGAGREEKVLGVERGRGVRRIRVAGRTEESVAPLSGALPAVVFEPHAHELVEGGPEHRRRMLDWGVFHVEQGFLEGWRGYQRGLRQRNVCLREGDDRGAAAWEGEMAAAGERVSGMRARYAERLAGLLPSVLGELAPEMEGVGAEFRPGWDSARALGESLAEGRSGDLRMGYTTAGPHRAELRLTVAGRSAARRLSRGQEKLFALGLICTQAVLYIRDTGRTPVILLDDLPSELDAAHLGRVVDWVAALDAQVFATAVSWPGAFDSWLEPVGRFHVEHGSQVSR